MATLDIASLGTLSPEMYAEQQALTRRQQMAQMLYQQGVQGTSQPQGQMVSGIYVPNSFFQNLVPAAQIAAGKYAMDKSDKDATGLAARLRKEKGDAMNNFRRLASDPTTMAEAMEYVNTNPYLGDLAKQLNAPRTRKVDEDFIIPGVDGKSIVLDQGRRKLPTNVEEVVMKFGLPQNPAEWTQQHRNILQNYIPPKDLIALQQTNARLADDGIGGVAIPNVGGNPMANVLRGQPSQGMPSGQPMPGQMPAAPMPGGAMPVQRAPMAAQGSQYQYDPNISPKENRAAAAKFNEDYQKNVKNAKNAYRAIELAAPILKSGAPSSGGFNAAVTAVREYFGGGGDASAADTQLNVLGGALVGMQPRFEGPQGVLDVELYKQMAGDVGNPKKPIAARMAALQSMIALQKKYDPSNDWDKLTEMLTPQAKPKRVPPGRANQDKQALDWANANPGDPRAAAIKQRLGQSNGL